VAAAEAVMRAMLAMFATGDVAAVADVVADEYHDHQGLNGVEIHGTDGFCRVVEVARASMLDLTITVEDLVADDERVAARIRWQGRSPSGDAVDRETIDLLRVSAGRAVEHWGARTG
jgi:predicted ester cyclase